MLLVTLVTPSKVHLWFQNHKCTILSYFNVLKALNIKKKDKKINLFYIYINNALLVMSQKRGHQKV